MITKANFKALLEKLSFQANGETYSKTINGYELKADFEKEALIYPKGLIVNERQLVIFPHMKILLYLNAYIVCWKKAILPNALN